MLAALEMVSSAARVGPPRRRLRRRSVSDDDLDDHGTNDPSNGATDAGRCIQACSSRAATGVRQYGLLEEYRGVGDVSVVGCVGSLIVATRGVAGAGEVLLTVRGSKEAYLAWSDQPLPRGTEVLVIDIRGARTVLVEPWPGSDFLMQIP